jgi:hypothetical protein
MQVVIKQGELTGNSLEIISLIIAVMQMLVSEKD